MSQKFFFQTAQFKKTKMFSAKISLFYQTANKICTLLTLSLSYRTFCSTHTLIKAMQKRECTLPRGFRPVDRNNYKSTSYSPRAQINQSARGCVIREAEMSTARWHYGWRASGHPSMHHYTHTVQVYGKQNRSE
jgi:hypothetical protein